MEKKTAIIYARVSTKGQADEELPIDSQIESCRKKAAALDAEVLRVFTDAGISGRTDVREAFQDAVTYCATHQVDYFVCWNTARFARNKIDAPLYKRTLEKGGTSVVYVSVDINNKTNEGWITESIFELFDELYSRQVSTDTMRSMVKNARDGFFNGGRIPFGYRVAPEGARRRLVIDEDEAPIVRGIFQQYIQGHGAKLLTLSLNAAGVKRRGAKWSKETVTNLLKNEVYTGRIVFGRVDSRSRKARPREDWIITQSHEPIISAETFDQVQQLLADRAPRSDARSPRSNFVFSGMLRCGSCGTRMQSECATGRNETYHYYNCRSAQKGTGCSHRRVAAAALDDYLVQCVMSEVFTTESLTGIIEDLHLQAGQWVRDRAAKRETSVRELRGVESRLAKLYELLELHGKDAPNLGDLTERLRELRSQKQSIERGLVELENMAPPAITVSSSQTEAVRDLLRSIVMTNQDVRKKREFFASFVHKIVIGDKTALIHYDPARLLNREPVLFNADWLPVMGTLRTAVLTFRLPERFVRAA